MDELVKVKNTGDVTNSLPKATRDMTLMITPWLENATSYTLGKFSAYTPNTDNPQVLLVTTDNNILLIDKESIGFSLSGGLNGVLLLDKSKKGIFDYISYDYIDSEGNVMGMVVDSGRDGQADTIFNMNENITSVWVEGTWYTLTPKDNKSGVIIDGAWMPINTVKGRHVFDNSSNKSLKTHGHSPTLGTR